MQNFGLGKKSIFRWLKVAREKSLGALAKARTGRNKILSLLEEEVKHWIITGDLQ